MARLMRILALVVLLVPWPLLGMGCLDRDDEPTYALTPDGFAVRGIGVWNSDWEQAKADFDTAVKRAALELEQTEGIPYDSVISWAHSLKYELHDHLFFRWQDGLYTGLYWPTREPGVWIAYWNYSSSMDPVDIPVDAPAWTVYQGAVTGLWYWGVYDPARMYPALAHELAWGFGISH